MRRMGETRRGERKVDEKEGKRRRRKGR